MDMLTFDNCSRLLSGLCISVAANACPVRVQRNNAANKFCLIDLITPFILKIMIKYVCYEIRDLR